MVKKLILITGMPGAGKTTLASYFVEMGFSVMSMGNVIRELVTERGLEPTPSILGSLAKEIRAEGGDDAVAKKCVNKMDSMDTDLVLIDGIRSISEVNKFKEKFDTKLIAVYASADTRYRRLTSRRRSDDPYNKESFHERDMRELGFSMGHAIALSDYMIINEGSLKDFKCKFNLLKTKMGLDE